MTGKVAQLARNPRVRNCLLERRAGSERKRGQSRTVAKDGRVTGGELLQILIALGSSVSAGVVKGC